MAGTGASTILGLGVGMNAMIGVGGFRSVIGGSVTHVLMGVIASRIFFTLGVSSIFFLISKISGVVGGLIFFKLGGFKIRLMICRWGCLFGGLLYD